VRCETGRFRSLKPQVPGHSVLHSKFWVWCWDKLNFSYVHLYPGQHNNSIENSKFFPQVFSGSGGNHQWGAYGYIFPLKLWIFPDFRSWHFSELLFFFFKMTTWLCVGSVKTQKGLLLNMYIRWIWHWLEEKLLLLGNYIGFAVRWPTARARHWHPDLLTCHLFGMKSFLNYAKCKYNKIILTSVMAVSSPAIGVTVHELICGQEKSKRWNYNQCIDIWKIQYLKNETWEINDFGKIYFNSFWQWAFDVNEAANSISYRKWKTILRMSIIVT